MARGSRDAGCAIPVWDSHCLQRGWSATERPNTLATYDLQGRQVPHPTRGLYIRNGKTVLVK